MTTFLDTSVLIDLLKPDSIHRGWSIGQLESAKSNGPVYVSDIVYSEFSTGMESATQANQALATLDLVRCGYSNEVLFRAAKAFKRYRNENLGTKSNVLPDFLIGALADVEGHPLLTRDPSKVKTYFPNVGLICPA